MISSYLVGGVIGITSWTWRDVILDIQRGLPIRRQVSRDDL